MKKSNILFFGLSLCLLFLLTTSCNKQEKNIENTFIGSITKTEYQSMNIEARKSYWSNRLTNLTHLKFFTSSEKKLLRTTVNLLDKQPEGEFNISEDLRMIAIDLAKTFNRSTYLSIFTISDLDVNLSRDGETCTECIQDLIDYKKEVTSAELRAKDCDCRWVCSPVISNACHCVYPSCTDGNSYQCCNPTSKGCGFFGELPCTHNGTIDCDCIH